MLLLLAVLAIAGFVAYTYVKQKAVLRKTAAKAEPALPPNTAATAEGWSWTKTTGQCTDVEVKARSFQQVREPSSFQLEGLEMKVFRSCGKTYDFIKSARLIRYIRWVALFGRRRGNHNGYSARRCEGRTHHRHRSSGVTFDSRTSGSPRIGKPRFNSTKPSNT